MRWVMPVVAFTVMVFVVMGLLVTAISAMVMVAAFIAAMATPLIGLDTTAFIAVMATLPIGHDTTAMVTVAVMAMVVAVAGRPEVMRSGEVSASPFDCKRRSNIYTFICILRNLRRGKELDKFRSVLNTVDTNKDGKISQSEFMTASSDREDK